jgi:hypothetical protein
MIDESEGMIREKKTPARKIAKRNGLVRQNSDIFGAE